MSTERNRLVAQSIASAMWAAGGAPTLLTPENVAETLRLREARGEECEIDGEPADLVPLIAEEWWAIARKADE